MNDNHLDELADTLRHLSAFALRRGNQGNADRVQQLLDKIETQTFNLVVFGEFKRGKTTFINALLGEDLLPSAVVPLTSVVTILRFGPQRQVTVHYLNGRTEVVPVERLADYVTERGNPHNQRRVKVVTVNVPSPLLRGGLQLVDTPGVGSVYDHNTEATREFLSQVDGAILLVASDPPISRGECEFLMEMRPHVARLFVVQNKIDQLRPHEAAESLSFTEKVLCDVLGQGGVEVYALSAREALEAQLAGDDDRLEHSGLRVFLEDLRHFQQHEQAETLLRSVIRNALEVADDERLGLDLERQAMSMSLEEIEAKSRDFRSRREALLTQREDDTTLIRAAARRLIAETLQRDYAQERESRPIELRQRFAAWAAEQSEFSPAELLERGNQFIRETLLEVLTEWREIEESRLEQQLTDILQRFTDRANKALSDVYDLAREVFELPPRSVETIGYLAAPSRFRWQDWRWETRPGLSGSPLGNLLPGARERTLRALEANLLTEHDSACGRLRHDFAERTQAAFEDYVRSVDRSLTETIAGIDRAIARAIAQKQRTLEEAGETAQRVDAESFELQGVIDELTTLQTEVPVHG